MQGTPGLRRRGAPGLPYPPLLQQFGNASESGREWIFLRLTDGRTRRLPSQGRGKARQAAQRSGRGADGVHLVTRSGLLNTSRELG